MTTATTSTTETAKPTFAVLVGNLATADFDAKARSGDYKQASENRSTLAVDTIKAAYKEKIDAGVVHRALIDAGIAKGTVSKIVSILTELRDKNLSVTSVKSLNGAYKDVQKIRALREVAAANARAVATGGPVIEVEAAKATPDDAVKIILDAIRTAKDPFKASGLWITRLTKEITDLVATLGDDEE